MTASLVLPDNPNDVIADNSRIPNRGVRRLAALDRYERVMRAVCRMRSFGSHTFWPILPGSLGLWISQEVLAEFGFSANEISDLRRGKVV